MTREDEVFLQQVKEQGYFTEQDLQLGYEFSKRKSDDFKSELIRLAFEFNQGRELSEIIDADKQPDSENDHHSVVGYPEEMGITPKFRYVLDHEGNPTDKIEQTMYNVEQAVLYDPELYQKLGYNEFTREPYVLGYLPWDMVTKYRPWTNSDELFLLSLLEDKYGFRSIEKMRIGIDNAIQHNKINPVKELYEKLYQAWDGQTGHIRRLLPSMLGAEDSDYTYETMKIFMLGAISRIYSPGCKFDYVPILVGKQGIGKSTFLRILSLKDEWFCDSIRDISDSDNAVAKLRGKLIIEFGELQAIKSTKSVEAIKAFITIQYDTYREPYSRRTENRPRMCVFCGTTNSNSFLVDKTGNRRYLPVECGVNPISIDVSDNIESARSEISQAWGEAMDLFKQANETPSLILPKNIQIYATEKQSEFTEEDTNVGIIQEWLDGVNYDRICVIQIWNECLKEERRPTHKEVNELHDIMSHNVTGWISAGKQRINSLYGVQKCYRREKPNTDSIDVAEIPFK